MAREASVPPRWVVGIDLGTTNCVLAAADTRAESPTITVMAIPQVVAPKQVEAQELLPSFLYLAGEEEIGALDLPWARGRDLAVGVLARSRGADVPGRLVSSAKSWLCNAAADRRAPILPWGTEEGARRVSPVAATATYLAHLRDAWNAAHAGDEHGGLEAQDVFLTVPASFDAAAREPVVIRRQQRDVAVVVFGDVETFVLMHPPITAVVQPAYDIGYQAANLLVAAMQSKERPPAPQEVILPTRLVIRASS